MANEAFRHNHYVPRWYQERFLPPEVKQRELAYLDTVERTVRDARGRRHVLPPVSRQPLRNCFAEKDLYTLHFHGVPRTDLERVFFGAVDSEGRRAIEWWTTWDATSIDETALHQLLGYMSTQKLRTPKGLAWIASQINSRDPVLILALVVRLQRFFGAIWSECVWQIADARHSATKFIVSDHPVTVYNRAYAPDHARCRAPGDPEIHLNGTHTIFPLSLERVLILTNRSWAVDPYGAPEKSRPNSAYERDSIFNFTDIQLGRELDEEEVIAINFIIKSRARRYIAAAEEAWLYPELRLPRGSRWSRLGPFHLLFPDPRSLHYGGDVVIGYADGSSLAMDVFGRRPGQKGYAADSLPPKGDPLSKFKAEFARRYGPKRRGFQPIDETAEDTDGLHQLHLSKGKPARDSAERNQVGPQKKRPRKRRGRR